MRAAPLFALLLALLAAPSAEARWRPPLDGPVTRPFDLGSDPYEGGRHRGIDLQAAPGAPVRAACAGTVVVAGRVGTSGRVATVLCGRWRVTHMPLHRVAVRPGQTVREGAALGTAAASAEHAGLHLGVRRDGARFGYVDPARFLGESDTPPPLAAPRTTGRLRLGPPPRPAPVARSETRTGPTPSTAPAPARPDPRGSVAVAQPDPSGSNPGVGTLAPWPAWAGLALVLAGVGVRWRRRPRPLRAPASTAAARPVRTAR
jgi:hypothetical protein